MDDPTGNHIIYRDKTITGMWIPENVFYTFQVAQTFLAYIGAEDNISFPMDIQSLHSPGHAEDLCNGSCIIIDPRTCMPGSLF